MDGICFNAEEKMRETACMPKALVRLYYLMLKRNAKIRTHWFSCGSLYVIVDPGGWDCACEIKIGDESEV